MVDENKKEAFKIILELYKNGNMKEDDFFKVIEVLFCTANVQYYPVLTEPTFPSTPSVPWMRPWMTYQTIGKQEAK